MRKQFQEALPGSEDLHASPQGYVGLPQSFTPLSFSLDYVLPLQPGPFPVIPCLLHPSCSSPQSRHCRVTKPSLLRTPPLIHPHPVFLTQGWSLILILIRTRETFSAPLLWRRKSTNRPPRMEDSGGWGEMLTCLKILESSLSELSCQQLGLSSPFSLQLILATKYLVTENIKQLDVAVVPFLIFKSS